AADPARNHIAAAQVQRQSAAGRRGRSLRSDDGVAAGHLLELDYGSRGGERAAGGLLDRLNDDASVLLHHPLDDDIALLLDDDTPHVGSIGPGRWRGFAIDDATREALSQGAALESQVG